MLSEKDCASLSPSPTKVRASKLVIDGACRVLLAVNPLFAFAFLDSFLETLQDYLGEITETTIKDNFDIVYMVRTASSRVA